MPAFFRVSLGCHFWCHAVGKSSRLSLRTSQKQGVTRVSFCVSLCICAQPHTNACERMRSHTHMNRDKKPCFVFFCIAFCFIAGS